MIVKIGKKTYSVGWTYANRGTGDRGNPDCTMCGISLVRKPKAEKPKLALVCHGSSCKHPNDNFCKDTGRKVSLTIALRVKSIKTRESHFNKNQRALIWAAYFEHCNSPHR